MNVEHLVKMANQIGSFFESMPDHQQAMTDLTSHLTRNWEPRMRRELLAYIEERGGAGLKPFVLEAIQRHPGELQ
ncbi:formate dehydrogenase delta subunit [Collimonas sp. OK242]|jgi:formate dehydrogenase subunit delta|uniref:formate dehydrogenase subunit delta n=1 Tax=Collimonas sp. OK242 TaxID=1798195 RepID=UPI0008954590|nr:formate dehydrogenase subunit delta [Collimonas sp. OK242]SDX48532.1 formate dehydrogenase delta subunit [Collimonas sp. OK242]